MTVEYSIPDQLYRSRNALIFDTLSQFLYGAVWAQKHT